MSETIEELKELHLLAKPELKQALIHIDNIIKNSDGKGALFAIKHLSDAIKSHDHVEDILFAEIESQKEEIERLTLQIKRAHLSLTWSNTENQIPHAIHHLEQAVPIIPDSPEYVAAAKIFLQEGEKP